MSYQHVRDVFELSMPMGVPQKWVRIVITLSRIMLVPNTSGSG